MVLNRIIRFGGKCMSSLASFTGCMMGGAIGDALGYPVEFKSYDQRIAEYGQQEIKKPLLSKHEVAEISDDTQMTLFTAEGLIWAEAVRKKNGYSSIPARCFCSYQRWLYTQQYPLAQPDYEWMIQDERLEMDSPLLKTKELYHRRMPKKTCIESLLEAKEQEYGTIIQPINREKGSGAVVRVAPIGLAFHDNPKQAFEAGCDVAAITHTHPTAYYSAGVFSAMISYLLMGSTVEEAASEAVSLLERCPSAAETIGAVKQAKSKELLKAPAEQAVKTFGTGAISKDALAIGIYCALRYEKEYKNAVCLAANHEGDTCAGTVICGSLLGAEHGITGLEEDWIKQIECKDLILKMACMLYSSYE